MFENAFSVYILLPSIILMIITGIVTLITKLVMKIVKPGRTKAVEPTVHQISRFRGACIALSLLGAFAGYFLAILEVDLFGSIVKISVYDIISDDFVRGSEWILDRAMLLIIPATLGLFTAIFSFMKSRPLKTIYAAVSAASMLYIVPNIGNAIANHISRDGGRGSSFFSEILGGIFATVYDDHVSKGMGFYVYVWCFLIVVVLNYLSIKNIYSFQDMRLPNIGKATVMVKCLSCGTTNPESADFCSKCGASLAPPPQRATTPAQPQQPSPLPQQAASPSPIADSSTIFCGDCGIKQPRENRYCDECGANLHDVEVTL